MKQLATITFFSILLWSCQKEDTDQINANIIDVKEYTADMVLDTLEIATFSGGNFYGMEAVFEQLRGVEKVLVGYCGSKQAPGSHKAVIDGKTKNVVATQVYYNPKKVSYSMLLAVYFVAHDPTEKEKQGIEKGKAYQPIIFYHSEGQQTRAIEKIEKESKKSKYNGKAIVTAVKPYQNFWVADEAHQDYAKKNINSQYVQGVVKPYVRQVENNYGAWMIKGKAVFPLEEDNRVRPAQ